MKYHYFFILCMFISQFVTPAYATQNILNIYSWGDYVPNDIIKQFTKETGTKVNLSEYDNNETMFAKIKATKNPTYDIVVPSSHYVELMAKQQLLLPLSKKKLSNFHHINQALLNKPFDPHNHYSVPYLWGSTGIIVNTKYINPTKITAWQNLWQPQYRNQVIMLNDMRDTFSIALLTLGYSINDTNPVHIYRAYNKLKQLLPNIKIFNVDTVPNIYIDEDAIIGMVWSGDYNLTNQENPHLKYISPKEGFPLWLESLVILKNAPHIDNAYKFIDFLLRPDIAKNISLTLGYATANKGAIKLMPKKLQNNPLINPPASLTYKHEVHRDLDNEVRLLYEKYWEKLKLGD